MEYAGSMTPLTRMLPALPIPLLLSANAVAAAAWLRAFPAATVAVPLFGAVLLAVLIAVAVNRVFAPRLVFSVAIDVMAFIVYTLIAVLRKLSGFPDLVSGLHHGPAEILTFSLPLSSPPTLLVAPVALAWLVGAVSAQVLCRAPYSAVGYPAVIIEFVLAYAATERSRTHRSAVDLLLGAIMFATLATLRAVQMYLRRSAGPQALASDQKIPLRPVALGLAIALVVAVVASLAVATRPFGGSPVAAVRVPAVNDSHPLIPLAFVAGLRPRSANDDSIVFSVRTGAATSGYVSLASVDSYDGDTWSFTRTFRPTGGIVPAEDDPALRSSDGLVQSRIRINGTQLGNSPWMPYVDRVVRMNGVDFNVDSASGMVVPVSAMYAGTSYTVDSSVNVQTLSQLPASVIPDYGAAPVDTQLPGAIRSSITSIVQVFEEETGASSSSPVAFLQALVKDIQQNYGLSGSSPTQSQAASVSATATAAASSTAPRTGSTNYSDVVASLLGQSRSGTPEQFATLVALIARQLGVPARVVTGFKIPSDTSDSVPAGDYDVHSSQATTWVEIPIREHGWVVLDSAPTSYHNSSSSASVGAAPATASPSAKPSQGPLLAAQSNAGHAASPPSTVTRAQHQSYLALILVLVILVLLGFLFWCVFVVLRRRRVRKARQTSGGPRLRVLGAWAEAIDELGSAGIDDIETMTAEEIAFAVTERFGSTLAVSSATLAHTANVAVFSPHSLLTDDDASSAWRAESALRKAIESRAGYPTRIALRLGIPIRLRHTRRKH